MYFPLKLINFTLLSSYTFIFLLFTINKNCYRICLLQEEKLEIIPYETFSSVQSLSPVWLFATPWTAAYQAFLSITRSWLKLMSFESVMPSKHLILCCPLLLPLNLSQHWVFSNELAFCIRWPKDWSFSLIISPSNEHPGLISFRMDWLDILEVQGTLMNLL